MNEAILSTRILHSLGKSGLRSAILMGNGLQIIYSFTASARVIGFWFWKKIRHHKTSAHLPLGYHVSPGPFRRRSPKTKKSKAENKKSLFDKKLLFSRVDFIYTITLSINRLLIVFWVDPYQKHSFCMIRKKWLIIPNQYRSPPIRMCHSKNSNHDLTQTKRLMQLSSNFAWVVFLT